MGLAGRREKQVIAVDPRNTKWLNDTNNPGHRLLANMGWKAGDNVGSDASASESDAQQPKKGLMAHESSKRLRKIPIPKSGNEGIGYRPNAGAAANIASGALPGSGAGGMASAASSVFSRLGSKAALQFVSAGASKEVINKAKTEGGEFAGLLQRLNAAAAASASASPSPAPEVAADGGENEEQHAGETKEERRERRRKRKAEKEEQRAAKKARKLAKSAGTPLAIVATSEQSEEETPAVAMAIVQSASAVNTAAKPVLLNPRMASRARHLASKRMLHASADALAEILGISPSPSSSAPGTPYTASSLPSTMPPSKAASPAPAVSAASAAAEAKAAEVEEVSTAEAKAQRKAEKKAAKLAAKTVTEAEPAETLKADGAKSKKKRKREE